MLTVRIEDGISGALLELLRKSNDFGHVMERVENDIIKPLRLEAWNKSGLHSRSGGLFTAIDTWHGKKSTGIALRTKSDDRLIAYQAHTQMVGARKDSYIGRKKSSYKVRGYRRKNSLYWVKSHFKRNFKLTIPWGDVPARPFMATDRTLARRKERIERMIMEHLQNV